MPKYFYAVRVGRQQGVYNSWSECAEQVNRYPRAAFKKFSTQGEAEAFASSSGGYGSSGGYDSSSGQRAKYYDQRRSAQEYYPPRRSVSYSTSHYSGDSDDPPHSMQPRDTVPVSASTVSPPPPHSHVCTKSSMATMEILVSPQSIAASQPVVYVDGCCFNNGSTQAQAGVGVYWGPGSKHNVSEKLTGYQSNQRAEVVSATRALETAVSLGHKQVEMRTDSMYTQKAMTEWVHRWESNGWKTAQNDDVKNRDDLKRLHQLCQKVDVTWTHVPAHKGIVGNEQADRLAKEGSQKVPPPSYLHQGR